MELLTEPPEDDAYYLTAMEEGAKTDILSEQDKLDFISSLKT